MNQRVEVERDFWDTVTVYPEWYINYITGTDTPTAERSIRYIKSLAGEVGRRAEGTILEIGCGPGRLTKAMAKSMPDNQVWGMDISAELIKIAQADIGHLSNLDFEVCDGRKLDVAPKSFDLIYSMLTFQHIPFDGFFSYLHSVNRALAFDGKFVFQYVSGGEDGNMNFNYNPDEVEEAGKAIGLSVLHHGKDPNIPNWYWMSLIKRSKKHGK